MNPYHLPPFADLHALAAWMCYASFLGLSLRCIEEDFAELLLEDRAAQRFRAA